MGKQHQIVTKIASEEIVNKFIIVCLLTMNQPNPTNNARPEPAYLNQMHVNLK